MIIQMAGVAGDSIVDGPGIRTAYFCQGCPHHCDGCHNPETWDFAGGTPVDTSELADIARRNPLCHGVTFSGGEPFAQADALADLADLLRPRYDIACYTGYVFEALLKKAQERNDEHEADKKARMRKAPLPPNERDW